MSHRATTLRTRLRELVGLPPRAGDSWRSDDGSTLTCLGKAPDPWDERTCNVCGDPAVEFKTTPPWPGTTYSPTSMACADHLSYLDGKGWQRTGDGEWRETKSTSSCATCGGPYGECGHTAHYAALARQQEAAAIRGPVHPSAPPIPRSSR